MDSYFSRFMQSNTYLIRSLQLDSMQKFKKKQHSNLGEMEQDAVE